MNFAYTPEQEALRQEVRNFIAKEFTPEVYAEMEEHNEGRPYHRTAINTPHFSAFFQKIADRGWVGISYPKEYGGQGGDRISQYIVEEEFYRINISISLGGSGALFQRLHDARHGINLLLECRLLGLAFGVDRLASFNLRHFLFVGRFLPLLQDLPHLLATQQADRSQRQQHHRIAVRLFGQGVYIQTSIACRSSGRGNSFGHLSKRKWEHVSLR